MSKQVIIERADGPVAFELRPDDFTIDPSHIDLELCNLGRTMLEYGELETELRLEFERKDAALEKLEADIDMLLRAHFSNTGVKVTEKKLECEIARNVTRLAAVESKAVSNRHWNMMRWAMKALEAKKDCLVALAYRERQLMKADEF